MRSSTPSICSGILALAVALVVVAWQRSRVAAAREAELANAERTLARLRSDAAILEKRVAAAKEVSAKRENPTPRSRRTVFRPAAQYVENPALTRMAYAPLVRRYFAGIYREAGFTSAQREQLENALAQFGPMFEAQLSLLLSGREQDGAHLVGDGLVEEVRRVLGEEGAAKFRDAVRVGDLSNAVDELTIRTHHTDAPLTAMQSRELMSLFKQAGAATGQKFTLQALDWDQVMQRAPAILAPSQVRVLEGLRTKAIFDREYERATGFAALAVLPEPEK